MQTGSEGALVKALGVRSLTASIVNTTIGAGIFVLPAAVAAGLGAAAPLAYVLCAALMALIVSCFAAAGSRVSLTGGLYAYVGVAFGPFIGFLAGVLYQLMAAFAVASVASAFAGSVAAVWAPAATPPGAPCCWCADGGGGRRERPRRQVRCVSRGNGHGREAAAAVVLVAVGLWSVNPEYVRFPDFPRPPRSAGPPSC